MASQPIIHQSITLLCRLLIGHPSTISSPGKWHTCTPLIHMMQKKLWFIRPDHHVLLGLGEVLQQAALHYEFWHLSIMATFHAKVTLLWDWTRKTSLCSSYASMSPGCPWPCRLPHRLSFFGSLLVGVKHCILGTFHKNCHLEMF